MDNYYDVKTIACKVKKDNSLYITAEGLAMSLLDCWTYVQMWLEDPTKEQIWDFIWR